MESFLTDVSQKSYVSEQLSLKNLTTWFRYTYALKHNIEEAKQIMERLKTQDPNLLIPHYKATGIISYTAIRTFDFATDKHNWFSLNQQNPLKLKLIWNQRFTC